MEREASDVVTTNGGTFLGSVRHPLSATDFSSFLLQAKNSKAQIIGLANGGTDTINAIKTAAEFGIVAGGQKLVGLVIFINDIHALGLKSSNGLLRTTAFYWDLNDKMHAFAERFAKRNDGYAQQRPWAAFDGRRVRFRENESERQVELACTEFAHDPYLTI